MTVQIEAERKTQGGFGLRKQKTLKQSASIKGVGLFTAEEATLTLHPLDSGSGIHFLRSDLAGKPRFLANLESVVDTPRCTILGNALCTVRTVEHILSALRGMQIDNALVELTGPEVPIMDGSAEPFVELIHKSGIEQLDAEREVFRLERPLSFSNGNVHLVALPADEMRISYTMHFPKSAVLRSQYFSARIDSECFVKEIAPCRTFCLYEEVSALIESGLIKGGGLGSAVVIRDDVVLNPEGIRFPDEMVRHKILDLIGDLALISEDYLAHIIAICSGHASNIAFAQVLHNHIKSEKALYGAN